MQASTIQNCLNFLDRVTLTGHQERLLMNDIVDELVAFRQKQAEEQQVDAEKLRRKQQRVKRKISKENDGKTDPI